METTEWLRYGSLALVVISIVLFVVRWIAIQGEAKTTFILGLEKGAKWLTWLGMISLFGICFWLGVSSVPVTTMLVPIFALIFIVVSMGSISL